MKNTTKKFYREMVSSAANHIKTAVLQYLPDSQQKDFMLWILADDCPFQEDYLRMMGVAGSIELELSLLNDVIDHNTLKKMSHYIGLLNAYFAFETLSDNIGVGLSSAARKNNATFEQQKNVLIVFNDAMLSKLSGNVIPATELLMPHVDLIKSISVYKKTLAPDQMSQFAIAYQKVNPKIKLLELEYSFFPLLVLNIETCLNLLNALKKHPIYIFLKESLIARYASVNALLKNNNRFNLEMLADTGTKSILVMPTLAFCIGALDSVSPNFRLAETLKNGSLTKSLYSASCLVRLLNDVGTNLLTLTDVELNNLSKDFKMLLAANDNHSVYEFLLNLSKQEKYFKWMPRIRKDLTQGEFNICLDSLNIDIYNGIDEFFSRIIFYATLYKDQTQTLQVLCDRLQQQLTDDKISRIILSFVSFHQKMYSKEFETKYGDYAITNESITDCSAEDKKGKKY